MAAPTASQRPPASSAGLGVILLDRAARPARLRNRHPDPAAVRQEAARHRLRDRHPSGHLLGDAAVLLAGLGAAVRSRRPPPGAAHLDPRLVRLAARLRAGAFVLVAGGGARLCRPLRRQHHRRAGLHRRRHRRAIGAPPAWACSARPWGSASSSARRSAAFCRSARPTCPSSSPRRWPASTSSRRWSSSRSRARPASAPARARSPGRGWCARRRRRACATLMLLFFVVTFGFANLEATFSLFLERRFDYGRREASYHVHLHRRAHGDRAGGLRAPTGAALRREAAHRRRHAAHGRRLLLHASARSRCRWLLAAIAVTAIGNGLNTPSLSSLISRAASGEHQGGVLGVSQSMGALGAHRRPADRHLDPQLRHLGSVLDRRRYNDGACVFAAMLVQQPSSMPPTE